MSRDDVDNGPPDPDDWFSEPDVLEPAHDQPAAATAAPPTESTGIDDWLDGSADAPPRRRRPSGMSASPSLVIAVVLGLVILLIVGLAVGGVFSSGSSSPNQPLFTITTHQTVTTQTTTTTKPSTSVPTTTLKPGDKGAEVKVLQLALQHLGYSVGKVDGVYGPATEQAVKSFQTAHGLTADGVCGPQTLAALKNVLGG
ncbi:MAG TPA: peptidoglycan-binding domain-containing protein [Gaiellaceae bacterium]|nr:peptidoglycan-binding domain-containing protein [Gaiellaceae bacterium]